MAVNRISQRDIMHGVTLEIEVTGRRVMAIRFKVGVLLLKLAAIVMGCGVEVRTAWDR